MTNSLTIKAGVYDVSIAPAVYVEGSVVDYTSPYTLSISYYDQTVVLNTRPSVSDPSITKQPVYSDD